METHPLQGNNTQSLPCASMGFACDECKTHLCFEFISHAILSILYPYSFKTHNISSKLGFTGFFLWKESDLVRKDAKCLQKES